MTASAPLIIVMAVMYASGVYVLLERSLTRVLIGFMLIGNATNLLILIMSGRSGEPPIIMDGVDQADFADPLPQALILTAIVINFGVTAFLLALIYRSWWLARLGDQGDTLVLEHEEDAGLAEEVFSEASEDDDALHDVLDASEEFVAQAEAEQHVMVEAAAAAASAESPATGPATVIDESVDSSASDSGETGEKP